MHGKPPRGLRDIAPAQFIDALYVLPAHPVGRHRVFRQLGLVVALRAQRGADVVGIGRLGEIVDGAHLHRGDGGGDVAIAGQDDAARLGPATLQRRDDLEAIAIGKTHVDHREGRRAALDARQPVRHRFGRGHGEATRFHGTRETLQERAIVIDDQQRAILGIGGDIEHFGPSRAPRGEPCPCEFRIVYAEITPGGTRAQKCRSRRPSRLTPVRRSRLPPRAHRKCRSAGAANAP